MTHKNRTKIQFNNWLRFTHTPYFSKSLWSLWFGPNVKLTYGNEKATLTATTPHAHADSILLIEKDKILILGETSKLKGRQSQAAADKHAANLGIIEFRNRKRYEVFASAFLRITFIFNDFRFYLVFSLHLFMANYSDYIKTFNPIYSIHSSSHCQYLFIKFCICISDFEIMSICECLNCRGKVIKNLKKNHKQFAPFI